MKNINVVIVNKKRKPRQASINQNKVSCFFSTGVMMDD